MPRVRVRVVKNNIPRVMGVVESEKDPLSRGVAEGAEERAKFHVPVLFGYLRASIHTTGGGGNYTVSAESMEGGAPRQYAGYVEYGTRKMAAQPFMTPAAAEAAAIDVIQEGREYGRKIEAAA